MWQWLAGLLGFANPEDEKVQAALFAAVTAALAAVLSLAGVVITIVNSRRLAKMQGSQKEAEQFREEIYGSDRELRNLRITAYNMLWKEFAPFRQNLYPLPEVQALKALADKITAWYFNEGGLVLTSSTLNMVLGVRDILEDLSNGNGVSASTPEEEKQRYAHIFDALSSLRTCLTADTYSRSAAQLSDSQKSGRLQAINKMLAAVGKLEVTINHNRLDDLQAEKLQLESDIQ